MARWDSPLASEMLSVNSSLTCSRCGVTPWTAVALDAIMEELTDRYGEFALWTRDRT